MVLVVEAFNRRFFDGPVHPFNLSVRPRMLNLGQPMLDAVFLTTHVKHMRHITSSVPLSVAWRKGEPDPIIGKNGMDFIWNSHDQSFKEC